MWTNAFHLAKPKWARKANDWDSELHCADVNSFIVSVQEVSMNGRLQSFVSVVNNRLTGRFYIRHHPELLLIDDQQKWKQRRFGTSSLEVTFLIRCYRSIYFRIFVRRWNFDKCIWAQKSSISCLSKLTEYVIVSFNLLRDARIKC